MKRSLAKGLLIVLAISLNPVAAISAQKVTAGSKCKVFKEKVTYKNKVYKCVKSGKKFVWSKGQLVVKATPPPTPPPTTSPAPSVIQVCSGLAMSEQGKFKISIQLMDPFDKSKTLNGGGLFLNVNSTWTPYSADITGKIIILIDPGKYAIDTLPPTRAEYFTSRKGYVVNVGLDGKYSISNSNLVENHCQIYSEPSTAGMERFSEVKKRDYKFTAEPLDIRSPTLTVKYTAPISNRRETPIVLDLYPWESEHFVLLTISNQHNPLVIGRYLRSLDLSYEIYNEATSNFPKYTTNLSSWSRMINGKSVIAEIPNIGGIDSANIISCGGNACTAVSTLGVEIRWQVLESTLWMLEHLDVYDHTLFYELGRTFWPQNSCASKISLNQNDPTITGFAVLMRYVVIKNLGLDLASDDNESGDSLFGRILAIEQVFSQNQNENLLSVFEKKSTINGFDGNAIWASLMTYLGQNYGGLDFYKKFFSSCDRLQIPTSDLIRVKNWKTLSEFAAGKNLDEVFIQRWRMP